MSSWIRKLDWIPIWHFVPEQSISFTCLTYLLDLKFLFRCDFVKTATNRFSISWTKRPRVYFVIPLKPLLNVDFCLVIALLDFVLYEQNKHLILWLQITCLHHLPLVFIRTALGCSFNRSSGEYVFEVK